MSKVKVSKTTMTQQREKRNEWPAVVYFWAFGLAITGYALARIGLAGLPHPYHGATGLISGVLGITIGWIWYRLRGDVI